MNLHRLFAILALVTTSPAFGADLANYSPPVALPSFNWTGLHLGVSGGFGFNEDDPSYSYQNIPPLVVPLLPTYADLDADGGLFGGTAGYDMQFGQFVVGVEGDFSWTDFGENAVNNLPGQPMGIPPLKFGTEYEMDWLSTVRGRVGIALDRVLLYGTAGWAVGKVSLDSSVTVDQPGAGKLTGSDDATKSGWTVGGGAAVALTDHISIKGEGLYYDLGHISSRSTDPNDPENSTLITDQDINGTIVRGGLDYRF